MAVAAGLGRSDPERKRLDDQRAAACSRRMLLEAKNYEQSLAASAVKWSSQWL